MPSISQAQAKALADDFFDSLGDNDKGDILKLPNTYGVAIALASQIVLEAQNNLNASNKISSGALSKSIVAVDPVMTKTNLRIDVKMLFYGFFQDSGVKGLQGGSSAKGYAFKKEMPGEDMVNAIKKWINKAKKATKTIRKQGHKPYGKHEKKLSKIAELDGAAFAVARSIKQKGLKASYFMTKAIAKAERQASSKFDGAVVIDVYNSIKVGTGGQK